MGIDDFNPNNPCCVCLHWNQDSCTGADTCWEHSQFEFDTQRFKEVQPESDTAYVEGYEDLSELVKKYVTTKHQMTSKDILSKFAIDRE